MSYTCSLCREKIEGDLIQLQGHTDKHIVDLIKHDHPEWVEGDGVCQKCVEYYRSEIEGSPFKDAPCAIRQRKIRGVGDFFKKMFGMKN